MHHHKLLFLLAVVSAGILSGCGDSPPKKLVGKWEITQASEVADRIGSNEDDPAISEPGESRMTLFFQSDGTLKTQTMMGSVNREKNGTWKMTSFDPETRKMKISCEINTQASEHDVTFVDEDTIELVPPNMAGLTMKLMFKRQ